MRVRLPNQQQLRDDRSNDGTLDPLVMRRQRVDPREHDQVSLHPSSPRSMKCAFGFS